MVAGFCEVIGSRRLALSLLLLSVACSEPTIGAAGPIEGVVAFSDGVGELAVEVADSSEEQYVGLMGRADLADNRGMAFVFEGPVEHTFWMRNTLIPLSIAFVDEQDRVISIREMVPCSDDACVRYGATAPYVLALEANRGWFRENGIVVGDTARFERTDG